MKHRPARSLIGALAYTAGVVGGVVGLLATPAKWKRVRPVGRRTSPISFRQAIFGHTKRDVAVLLGPPPAAAGAIVSAPPTFWNANTWYYPFDSRRQTAVAVQFSQDRVVRVEFIGGNVG
jgi:outer membrane protein assembly factor BamE (lipoprotein component of BamABCDE complex)